LWVWFSLLAIEAGGIEAGGIEAGGIEAGHVTRLCWP
tara:strand:- start:132 stop:242 length:111 start_codon:yes stop_codon:yes gene_type:complete